MTTGLGLSAEAKSLREQGVTSVFVCCISYSIHFGKLFFRALLSEDEKFGQESDKPKWKFPGGMLEGAENVEESFYREWFEECMRPSTKVELDYENTHEVLVKSRPDENHSGGIHLKMFRMFNEKYLKNYRGDMHFRSSPIMEPPVDGNPGGILYVAQPIRVPTLCELMRDTYSLAHREALVLATRHLVLNSREMFNAVPADFRDWVLTDDYMNRK